MQRLSICLLVLALATSFLLSGIATTSAAARTSTATTSTNKKANDPLGTNGPKSKWLYYWYTYPADTYFDQQTIPVEEFEWIYLLGTDVNTNLAGGTLVARGYTTNNYPHAGFASVYLFAHY